MRDVVWRNTARRGCDRDLAPSPLLPPRPVLTNTNVIYIRHSSNGVTNLIGLLEEHIEVTRLSRTQSGEVQSCCAESLVSELVLV